MTKFAITAGALAVALMIPVTDSAAQERRAGPYIGSGIGANFANDTEVDGSGINGDVGHDAGYVGLINLGYGYANGMRAELETSFRRNPNDGDGSVSALSGMLNGYYDFATGSAWTPYIGAGIGIAALRLRQNPIGGTSVNNRSTDYAIQGIAGVSYQFDYNWAGTLEYRYFTAPDVGLTAANGAGVDADYSAHSIMVGLRYTFGEPPKPAPEPAPIPAAQPAPPPPPPPAPEPEPITRNFIVFFDWDQSTISPEAMQILRSAAENARNGGISRVEATGHADRSGTQTYNLGLSQRRAEAVRAELTRLGIPAEQIGLDWKGELEPLVPTNDGVREPQNRRVEIIFP